MNPGLTVAIATDTPDQPHSKKPHAVEGVGLEVA
jgi:hypothetical protein